MKKNKKKNFHKNYKIIIKKQCCKYKISLLEKLITKKKYFNKIKIKNKKKFFKSTIAFLKKNKILLKKKHQYLIIYIFRKKNFLLKKSILHKAENINFYL